MKFKIGDECVPNNLFLDDCVGQSIYDREKALSIYSQLLDKKVKIEIDSDPMYCGSFDVKQLNEFLVENIHLDIVFYQKTPDNISFLFYKDELRLNTKCYEI